MKDIMISVICPTYNHETHIADALDGFVIQEADFPIEFIIHDDASTDRTAEIIRDYQRKHPKLFHCIFQTENQYSKRASSIIHDITFPKARGKYIAICEGDDYWTDRRKLAKQVRFMEGNPKLSMSFHGVRFEYPRNGDRKGTLQRYRGRRSFTAKEMVVGGGGFYPTCSAVFRRDVFTSYPSFFLKAPVCDAMWALNAITKGDIGYIDEVMGVYNVDVPGSWTANVKTNEVYKTLGLIQQIEDAHDAFDCYTGYKYTKPLRIRNSRNYLGTLALASRRHQGYTLYDQCRGKLILKHRFAFHALNAFVGFEVACARYPLLRVLRRPLGVLRRIGTKLT